MISYNLDSEPKSFYIGLKRIMPGDFSNFDFYTITVCILGVIALSLLIVFIVLNNSLNKLI